MYSFIIHPINRKKYPIHSNTAKHILKLYISNLLAGSDKLKDIKDKVKVALKDYVARSIEQGYPGVYITPRKNAPSWNLLSLDIPSRKKSSFRLEKFILNDNDNIFQIKFTGDKEKQSDKYITFSDTYKLKSENLKKYLKLLNFNLVNPNSKEHPYISEKDLDLNYIIDNESEEILLTNAPFIVKLRALKKINYSFKNDTLNHISNFVHSNWDQNLDPFVNQSELFFSTTIGLTLYINGVNIQNISDYEHPLRIIIKPSPPSMIIQRYKPIN